ncbi:MAG: hypothetical protein BZ138_04630 [Methanosphaera sp. rholeuAM270]|nr:MAG: hypothetical protein BZ138_04630 [Methanosphaera sp. rholeuAM270]
MKIDENWFKLYEKLFGKQFNRLLTIGNGDNGYINYNIDKIEEIRSHMENFPNNEFYISLYNYLTKENILRWDTSCLDKYEKYAEKSCILFRFRQSTDIIQEEVNSLSNIQKFMFIRRSINLGFNKEIVVEAEKTYNFFKTHCDIKGTMFFNGYNECLLYLPKKDLSLNHPSLTYYNLLKLVEEKLELNTLVYENIEPYAQLMPIPGTQNKHSRLYVQLYYASNTYEEIMNNAQNKFFDFEHLKEFQPSEKFHKFLKEMDKEVSKHEKDSKYNFDKIWDSI